MARVTIEDCSKKIPNRFELCMIASQRVKEINSGSQLSVESEKKCEKVTVIALKEIAAGLLDKDILKASISKSFFDVHHYSDESTDDDLSLDDSKNSESDDHDNFIFNGEDEGYDYEDIESDEEDSLDSEFTKS